VYILLLDYNNSNSLQNRFAPCNCCDNAL